MANSRRRSALPGLAVVAVGAVSSTIVWLARRHQQVVQVPEELRHRDLYLPMDLKAVIPPVARSSVMVPSPPSSVRHSVHTATAPLAEPVAVHVYAPLRRDGEPLPVVLYLHGGGYIGGTVEGSHERCADIVERVGAVVVNVDYRLAPDHPFPAPLDDCCTALRWVRDQASELGVDASRIALAGDSAGGGLAAALAQRAHDDGLPVRHQVLLYPMLDDRTVTRQMAGLRGAFIWTPASNRAGWRSFLGTEPGSVTPPPHAVAARRVNLSGLPSAWIGVGEHDLFHDEDVRYAERLREAGVEVELRVVPGMYHAADALCPDAPAMQQFTEAWQDSLRRALA